MPRPKSLIPKLCVDKSRNRAFCKVDGKFVSLGNAGSPESMAAYGNLLRELAEHGKDAAISAVKRHESVPREPKPEIPLSELFLRFINERLPKYAPAERRCIRGAIRIARALYGETPAEDFDVLRLRTVRDGMIRHGWGRSFINKQVKRLRMVIRWAVGWKIVSQTLAESLKAVEPLEPGDSDAPESRPRYAVPDERIQAIRPFLAERYRDLVDLMFTVGESNLASGSAAGSAAGVLSNPACSKHFGHKPAGESCSSEASHFGQRFGSVMIVLRVKRACY